MADKPTPQEVDGDFLINVLFDYLALTNQQRQIVTAAIPTGQDLVDALNQNRPLIAQAVTLYAQAQPLVNQVQRDWDKVGPAAQIIMDALAQKFGT